MTAVVDDVLARLRSQDEAAPGPGASIGIAETAERTGITAHTLRYYERIGLLSVGRDASGYRRYTDEDFRRIVFVNRLRMTGMPIRDLVRYIELIGDGEATVAERLAILQAHRDSVRTQLAELQFALDAVEFKIAAYGGTCSP